MNIAEIAKRANVSTATVSRTLNQSGPVKAATARKVWRAVTEMNYYPNSHARALVSGRSRLIGLIVSDITNPFFPELIRAFQDLAAQKQYRRPADQHRLPDRPHDRVPPADARAQSGRRRHDDVRNGSRPDQGTVAAQCADRIHGRRTDGSAHEPRRDRLWQRHPAGRRSRRRARTSEHRLHQWPARSAFRTHAAPGVPRWPAASRARRPTAR